MSSSFWLPTFVPFVAVGDWYITAFSFLKRPNLLVSVCLTDFVGCVTVVFASAFNAGRDMVTVDANIAAEMTAAESLLCDF